MDILFRLGVHVRNIRSPKKHAISRTNFVGHEDQVQRVTGPGIVILLLKNIVTMRMFYLFINLW
jgi:hypothetical protein